MASQLLNHGIPSLRRYWTSPNNAEFKAGLDRFFEQIKLWILQTYVCFSLGKETLISRVTASYQHELIYLIIMLLILSAKNRDRNKQKKYFLNYKLK